MRSRASCPSSRQRLSRSRRWPRSRRAGPSRGGLAAGTPLADHLRFAEAAARRLADQIDRVADLPDADLRERQRFLGRIVDIGAELYAMSASCAYAATRSDHAAASIE